MSRDLSQFQRGFKIAALVCSAASALLTFVFGLHQGVFYVAMACAAFLVACSLGSDYVWLFVVKAFRERRWGMVATYGLGAVFMLSLNLISNVGSVGWQRDNQTTKAQLSRAAFKSQGDNVEDLEKDVERISEALKVASANNGWITTQNAAALRAEAESLKFSAERESRTGKGPIYDRKLKEWQAVEAKIAMAESYDENTRKLESLKARLVTARAKAMAAGDSVLVSAPVSQAEYLAGMMTISLAPSEPAKAWADRGMATWIALGLCFMPILCSLIAWGDGQNRSVGEQSGGRVEAKPKVDRPESSRELVVVHDKDRRLDDLLADLKTLCKPTALAA